MSEDAVDNAWKIHDALVDWTGKVDTKASFALTIESAALAGVLTLSGGDRVFGKLNGPATLCYVIGVSALIASVVCAAWVVRPRLRTDKLEAESLQNYIYFGHLRYLSPGAVVRHLEGTPILPVLANQLVAMSGIAWQKHRLVKSSMLLALVGAGMLGLAAFLVKLDPIWSQLPCWLAEIATRSQELLGLA